MCLFASNVCPESEKALPHGGREETPPNKKFNRICTSGA